MNICNKLLISIVSILTIQLSYAGFPNNNLFNPYDILLYKPMPYDSFFDFDIGYEGAFNAHAYQADPDDRVNSHIQEHENVFRREAPVLEIWQDSQEFFPALSGAKKFSKQDTDAHAFNIRQEKIDGRLKPEGDLSVPLNLMLAARFQFPWSLTLGFYLPVLVTELKNIKWRHVPCKNDLPAHTTFTGRLDNEIGRLERDGNLDLRKSWKHHGVGDLAAILWWWHDYPQAKRWLKNVHVGVRGGLTFPTGSNGDLHRLFQLPFGHDGGVGIIFGGTLELDFLRFVRLGIDGEFLNLFGSSHERRFQTDKRQTDLIFLNKQFMHKEPGFTQHYTLYLKVPLFVDGLSSLMAYQHTRQHEDTITLDDPTFDVRTINQAESFQDWTTHSIIWKIDYDSCQLDDRIFVPGFSFFVKHGFNGKRALLFDTVGLQLNLSF